MYLVLDKSFLQGASKKFIEKLCSHHQVIMPEVLLMEILTTDEKDMHSCIAKFPNTVNPVNLIPNVGTLIRYEVINKKPCTPIESQFINETFILNKNFVLSQEQLSILSNWEDEVSTDSFRFIQKAVITQGWFPELQEYKPGISISKIEEAMGKVANNSNFVKEIYAQIHNEIRKMDDQPWPNESTINQDWAIYRYHQVHLLYALEYIRRYGFSVPNEIKKKLENFRIDIDYCVIGALSDGLLTNDNLLVQLYTIICPKKRVIKL